MATRITNGIFSRTLRFPRGVRLAGGGDLPGNDRREKLARIKSAKINAGFVSMARTDTHYSAYLEANVHADEVWAVFEALASRFLQHDELALSVILRRDAQTGNAWAGIVAIFDSTVSSPTKE
jgi:hypothetical protein